MIDVPSDLMRPSLIPFADWMVRFAPRDGDVGRLRRYLLDDRDRGCLPGDAKSGHAVRRHVVTRHHPDDRVAAALAAAENL